MATSAQIFAALAPTLASDSRRDLFLELAAARITANGWGGVYAQAVCLMAAHMMVKAPTSDDGGAGAAAAGPITSKGGGDLSIGYGAVSSKPVAPADMDLASTEYGRAFIQLRDTRATFALRFVPIGT